MSKVVQVQEALIAQLDLKVCIVFYPHQGFDSVGHWDSLSEFKFRRCLCKFEI
jgi:hypothetical protein